MNIQNIVNYIGAEPFEPFRINMASGQSYEIRHPEMVQVGRTTVTIHTYMSDDENEAEERKTEVALILIDSIEPLDLTARRA